MRHAVLDDHLLRDLLVGEATLTLERILEEHAPATTNLYLARLCRSVVRATGGSLTGSWSVEARRELGRWLVMLPDRIKVVTMRTLAFRMAELAHEYRLSTLGAEAVAAAEHLDAVLCVWSRDDGPRIRAAMTALAGGYRTISR